MIIVFTSAAVLLAYVYLGYPLLLWGLSRVLGRPHGAGPALPTVTIVVAAYQEAAVIGAKLTNFENIDYPAARLKMIVVSDGSTDGTDEIVRRCGEPRVRLLRQEPRRGKAAALGLALDHVDTEVVVFTDANVLFDPEAIRQLVRAFGDPEVGAVTGTVHLQDTKAGYAESEGAYYRYERFLQRHETRLWSVVGVDGALYAVRRSLVSPPPKDAILDDFVISMDVARRGWRIVYEPLALAREHAAPSVREEFRRKVRVATGAFQSVRRRWGMPGLQARLLSSYVSHKLLRWLSPLFMIAVFVSSAVLVEDRPVAAAAFFAQVAFYGLALLGVALPRARRASVVKFPMYFTLMSVAFAIGLRGLRSGRLAGKWTPTPRSLVPAAIEHDHAR